MWLTIQPKIRQGHGKTRRWRRGLNFVFDQQPNFRPIRVRPPMADSYRRGLAAKTISFRSNDRQRVAQRSNRKIVVRPAPFSRAYDRRGVTRNTTGFCFFFQTIFLLSSLNTLHVLPTDTPIATTIIIISIIIIIIIIIIITIVIIEWDSEFANTVVTSISCCAAGLALSRPLPHTCAVLCV
jgi:hypothetical protein